MFSRLRLYAATLRHGYTLYHSVLMFVVGCAFCMAGIRFTELLAHNNIIVPAVTPLVAMAAGIAAGMVLYRPATPAVIAADTRPGTLTDLLYATLVIIGAYLFSRYTFLLILKQMFGTPATQLVFLLQQGGSILVAGAAAWATITLFQANFIRN